MLVNTKAKSWCIFNCFRRLSSTVPVTGTGI